MAIELKFIESTPMSPPRRMSAGSPFAQIRFAGLLAVTRLFPALLP
jgi:hypothetical protein